MHKIQASSGGYFFAEDSNENNNKSQKLTKFSNLLGNSLKSSGSFKASNRWVEMAQKIKQRKEDVRSGRSRRVTLSNVAIKVMNLNHPESSINREIKRLQKVQAKLERRETKQFEEAREIARKLHQQKMLQRNLQGSLQYARKISVLDIHGKKLTPIERFQKIVRLLCFLLKIKSSTDRKYKQEQHGGVFEQLDELTETVVCNDDGMVFDPTYFKAVKDVKLSSDAVQILSMAPGTRTEEQLQAALAGLKASVAAFGEYPLKMQRRLVSVGWYESFEAKRVIIRQGHRAENFYFILSGTALVTLLVNDLATGEERTTTVAVLGKGCSFGELALLHHKTRSATVLCRNEVALLAVGREDFRDIFMSYEDGKETEHIQFLRNIPYIKDLPLDQCSTRPDICIFHYFRRGVVIVKNSKTEWIYIIKSGSCRVLTNLVKRRASLQTSKLKANTDIFSTPAIPVDEYERRKLLYTGK
ncbi:uncharacterized protein LOC110245091 [Exaiptasia diaphana]|uniref:Cyclic nucleotide-binding domain-containing protein n=1 Tax=Exaiptasia diaphana TaxID=2652724 RepID=A0A913YMG7_EXADI|nr:uncharacterized protein LOC110245091 [Exaiptasia diaphana]